MQGLSDLNNYSQTSIEVQDLRPSGILLDRPWSSVFKTFLIGPQFQNYIVEPNMLEIINWEVANVRYRLDLATAAGGVAPPGIEISYMSLPAGITAVDTGSGVEFSGFKNAAEFNQVKKNFIYKIPPGSENYPVWWFRMTIKYYDSYLNQEMQRVMDFYDPRFYPLAAVAATSAMTVPNKRGRTTASNFVMASDLIAIPSYAKDFDAVIESWFEASAQSSDIGSFDTNFSIIAAGVSGQAEFPLISRYIDLVVAATGDNALAHYPPLSLGIVSLVAANGDSALANFPPIPVIANASISAQVERMFNTASDSTANQTYVEDQATAIGQVISSGLDITAWRPEETFIWQALALRATTEHDGLAPAYSEITSIGTSSARWSGAYNPYNNHRIIAGVSELSYSTDGTTWTTVAAPWGTPVDAYYNPYLDHWIVVDGTKAHISTDGINFSSSGDVFPTGSKSIAYSPTAGYAVSWPYGVYTSTNGITWTARSAGSGIINDIAYSPYLDLFVVVNSVGNIATSKDGITWTTTNISTSSLNGIVWTGEHFVIVGSDATVLRSTHAITWTPATTVPAGTGWRRVKHHSETNVLMAVAGTIFSGVRVMYSYDKGDTWTQAGSGSAVINLFPTREGFIICSTTGTYRAITANLDTGIGIAKFVGGNYPRLVGTATGIETGLADVQLLGAIDSTRTYHLNYTLRHPTVKLSYLTKEIKLTGQAEVNVVFPTINPAWYRGAYPSEVLQAMTSEGLAITDSAENNQYYVTVTDQGEIGPYLVDKLVQEVRSTGTPSFRSITSNADGSELMALEVQDPLVNGYSITTYYSSDGGISWEAKVYTTSVTYPGNSWVLHNGTEFVLFAQGSCARFVNGAWVVDRTISNPSANRELTLYAHGYYFLGSGTTIRYSQDAITWQTAGFTYVKDIAVAGNKVVAVGLSAEDGDSSVYFKSFNPTTGVWSNNVKVADRSVFASASSSWPARIGGSSSRIYINILRSTTMPSGPEWAESTDGGATWNIISPAAAAVRGLPTASVPGPGLVVDSIQVGYEDPGNNTSNWMISDGNQIYFSEDGSSWTSTSCPIGAHTPRQATKTPTQYIYAATSSSVIAVDNTPTYFVDIGGRGSHFYEDLPTSSTNISCPVTYDSPGRKLRVEVGSQITGKPYGSQDVVVWR